jgi:sirohydrochlorin ferrochelatase
MTDLLLIGHGSRTPAAAKEFGTLVELVDDRLDGPSVAGGFLELSDPPIDEALDGLVAAGACDVVAVPYVLFGAGHLKDDGPAVLGRARQRHPGVRFRLARDLGIHPAVLDVAEQRVRRPRSRRRPPRRATGGGPRVGGATPGSTPSRRSCSSVGGRPTPTPAPTP